MYWQVEVKVQIETEEGKVKKVSERYLIEAYSATDAEAKIVKEFEGESNYVVNKVVKSNILKVIENE